MKSLQYVELDCDVYRITQFEAARVGEPVPGWSPQWKQATSLVGQAVPSFPSGIGTRMLEGSAGHTFWRHDQTPELTDSSTVALLRHTSGSVNMGLLARGSGSAGSENCYLLNIWNGNVNIFRGEAGSFVSLAATPFVATAGVDYWVRFDVADVAGGGALVRGKVWEGEVTDEPEDFDISFEDVPPPAPFPTVVSITETGFPTATTTHNVVMPATVTPGDLLLVFFSHIASFGDTTITPAGWTQLVVQQSASGATRSHVFAKVAIGNEDGTSVNFVTTAFGAVAVAQVHRVLAADWWGSLDGVTAGGPAIGNSTAPNPGALAVSWGELNTLWIAFAGWYSGGSGSPSIVYPSLYTGGEHTPSGGGSLIEHATAQRELNTDEENPGQFTLGSSRFWVALAVAVRPAPPAAFAEVSPGRVGLYGFNAGTDHSVGHFRARSILGTTEEALRFALPVDYLPKEIDCIPNIKAVNFQPMIASLGEDLGLRANITVNFADHKWADLGELYESGTYFGKFKARKLFRRGQNIRIIRGLEGQAIEDMDTRHYVTETFEGPDPQSGAFSIVAKDPLKLADDNRAQAPVLSNGFSAGSLSAAATTVPILPTGIGNLEYPLSGHVCIGGNEVCSFTRVGDTLTCVRGALGTTASTHNANDRVQLVLYYPGNDPADVAQDLFINYANVPSDFIPLADWAAETAENLNTIYTQVITEPTAVKELLSTLCEEAALVFSWDDSARLIRMQVLKQIATDASTFDEDTIIEGTLKTKEQPDKRISQIWAYYNRRDPTKKADQDDNYRNTLAQVDLERESEYGSPEIYKLKARWIATEPSASRINQINLSRFRDPPRRFNFDLFRGTPIQLAGGYRVSWWGDVDESGHRRRNGAPIQITKVTVEPDFIRVEAEEMLASGVVVLRQMVILTTTGSLLQWSAPPNFNPLDNQIECLGAGGGGDRQGGGGAAYASINNLGLSFGALVQYRVGAKGVGRIGAQPQTSGGDSWFGASTLATSLVGAKGGIAGNIGGTGGTAAASIGTDKFSGGDGGHEQGTAGGGGGGGGGAAGPHGDGGDGGNGAVGNAGSGGGGGGGAADGGSNGSNSPGHPGGNGGNNRFGVGKGVAGSPNGTSGAGGAGADENGADPSGNGSADEMWTQTIAPIFSAGPAGAPGGGGEFSNGLHAPNYGAGGSGRGNNASIGGGNGSQGIIVINWTEV